MDKTEIIELEDVASHVLEHLVPEIQRIRIDRESEANHDLIRLLNKPDLKE